MLEYFLCPSHAGKVSQAPPAYPTNPNQNPAYGQNPAYPSQPYPSAAPAGAYPSAALTGAYPSAALAGPYPVQGQQYAVEVHQPTFATSQVVVTSKGIVLDMGHTQAFPLHIV